MVRRNRTVDRSVALFVLGAILLLPPLLLVFNRPDRIAGIPVLYLYVFAAWCMLIALAAAIARSIPREEADSPPPASPAALPVQPALSVQPALPVQTGSEGSRDA